MGIDFYIGLKDRPYTNAEIIAIVKLVSGVTIKSRDIGRYRRYEQKRPRHMFTHKGYEQANKWYRRLHEMPALDICSIMVTRDNRSVCIGRGYRRPEGADYCGEVTDLMAIFDMLDSNLPLDSAIKLFDMVDLIYWC